jgi:DNA-binding response OmpR family regulator
MIKILGVDDSLTIRKLVEMVLGRSGYQVTLASSGKEAIGLAAREKPDLVLLDYVLPDMKGTEVCQEMLRDPVCRKIPVLLMSAKGAEIRQLYQDIPTVVDYLTKPFTPEVLKAVVAHTLQKVQGAKAVSEKSSGAHRTLDEVTAEVTENAHSFISKETREAAARAIYQHLKGRLALLPEWLEQYQEEARRGQGETPAVYFARRLLRREVIDGLFDELRLILGEGDGLQLSLIQGRSNFYPMSDVLQRIGERKASGVLNIQAASWSVDVYFVDGQVTIATSDEPRIYAQDSSFPFNGVPLDILQKAVKKQRASKKPLFLTLQEAGILGDPAEVGRLLRESTLRCMVAVLKERDTTFRFQTVRRMPDFAQGEERIRVSAILFESLRSLDDWSLIEKEIETFDAIFTSSGESSRLVAQLSLRDDERLILNLVDGCRSIRKIIDESGLKDYATCRILYRLLKAGILAKAGESGEVKAAPEESEDKPAKVVLVTPRPLDEFGALQEELGEGTTLEVFNNSFGRVPYLIHLLRPDLIGIETGRSEFDSRRLVQELRSDTELANVPIYALAMAASPEIDAEMKVFGFGGVLTLPVDPEAVENAIKKKTVVLA